MTRRSDIPSPPVEQCDSKVRRILTKDYNVLYVVSPRKADAAVGRGSPRQRTLRALSRRFHLARCVYGTAPFVTSRDVLDAVDEFGQQPVTMARLRNVVNAIAGTGWIPR